MFLVGVKFVVFGANVFFVFVDKVVVVREIRKLIKVKLWGVYSGHQITIWKRETAEIVTYYLESIGLRFKLSYNGLTKFIG